MHTQEVFSRKSLQNLFETFPDHIGFLAQVNADVIVISLGQKTYVIRESLKQILERLPAEHFLRVHKSAIVNVREVVELEHLQNAEYMIKLRSGVTVKVSRTYKKTMEGYLKNI